MGHYDSCRPGNCPACGQALNVVWNCGRRYCSTYHQWLRENDKKKYDQLMAAIRAERETAEEKRVTNRQIARRTAQIAAEAKVEAEK